MELAVPDYSGFYPPSMCDSIIGTHAGLGCRHRSHRLTSAMVHLTRVQPRRASATISSEGFAVGSSDGRTLPADDVVPPISVSAATHVRRCERHDQLQRLRRWLQRWPSRLLRRVSSCCSTRRRHVHGQERNEECGLCLALSSRAVGRTASWLFAHEWSALTIIYKIIAARAAQRVATFLDDIRDIFLIWTVLRVAGLYAWKR